MPGPELYAPGLNLLVTGVQLAPLSLAVIGNVLATEEGRGCLWGLMGLGLAGSAADPERCYRSVQRVTTIFSGLGVEPAASTNVLLTVGVAEQQVQGGAAVLLAECCEGLVVARLRHCCL